ncbi:MAG: hypothetical protein R3F41_20395 [Gammaproteobacteria bacterium]|nr:hypothetical protein [Pseudomonadales bacterium]MCP5346508.1 hypothetical protein [Pseudomonadales bacterium]
MRQSLTKNRNLFQRNSHFRSLTCSLLLACLTGFVADPGLAQSDTWQMPRTVDGQPDLQGVWANNTITPLERPEVFGDKAFLTDEDMAFLQRRIAEITREDGDALFGDGVLEAAFSGEARSFEPSTGNYDQSWLVQRNVHNRTSQIIYPLNGKFPARTEAAIAATRDAMKRYTRPPRSWEDRGLTERCISFGAPYLGTGYNSYWQIVQSRDHVIILQEMIHDARIIPLVDKPHIDEDIRLWHGDSRGWWEGDTLVIETTNYADKSAATPEASRVVNLERLTRISDDEIRYQLTSQDPGQFNGTYTRELILDYSPDPIYEYACHEGNYAMEHILAGARAQERRQREAGGSEN